MEEVSSRDCCGKWLRGGIGGWFGLNNQGVLVDSEEDISHLREEESLKVKQSVRSNLSDKWGKVSELDRTVLGTWKWKSEGVGEDLIFIKGWDRAGQHQRISSDKHSQGERDLWGGRNISFGNAWFGPRQVTKVIDDMEKVKKEKLERKDLDSYWPIIQKSAQYLNQEDLVGLQRFWQNRSRGLEEDIFGLYKGWNWWAEKFGKKTGKELVDLEFDFSKIKHILEKSEEELRDQKWSYGRIFQNPKLSKVRLLGDVEATAFNYLKHVAWPETGEVKNLKEKKIAIAILALMLGEEIGFDCEKGEKSSKEQFFKECLSPLNNTEVTLKRVLKSTFKSKKNEYKVPVKGHGGSWHLQDTLKDTSTTRKLLRMDDVRNTSLLDEKCEDSAQWWQLWIYGETEIRREICDQILRPWFGDVVSDKRLCLFEVKDFSNYLRLNTYLQVLEIPIWNNRNTFWTKCSNYGI